jgi:hypothetical protein
MAITTYATLKTAVENWLGRSDLDDRIPEFIALAEADMARNLRKEVVREAFTLTSGEDSKALPAGCAELRSLRYNTSTLKFPLDNTTEVGLADVRRAGSGVPTFYAVVDGTVLFDVAPSDAFAMEIVYYSALTQLANDADAVSLRLSDLYLFGALKEAAPYLEHDERVPLWEAKYNKAINDENSARERAELGATPTVRRLPVVFG